MWKLTLKRIIRSPLPAVGVLLFAMAMAVVLQSLHHSKIEAQEYYEEIYNQIDVTCTVTNLRGTRSDGLYLNNEIVNEFTEYRDWLGQSSILSLIENVQIKSQHQLSGRLSDSMLVGITSLEMAQELWPENGCTIFWNAGFDETIFDGNTLVCLIPQTLAEKLAEEQGVEIEGQEAVLIDTIPVQLDLENYYFHSSEPGDYNGTMRVAGVYTGGDQKTVYCSWLTLMGIWDEMGQIESAVAAHATLLNNGQVAVLREAASEYFAEPNPNADSASVELALDIDDSKLQDADLTLRNSLRVNELSTLLVFSLSAGVGFLIGFLMIRSRKKEIALLRTMGTPNQKIYTSYAGEQMLCLVFGTFIGAATYRWQPPAQLIGFVCIYFIGLTVALQIFLHKNLLTTIKEDE